MSTDASTTTTTTTAAAAAQQRVREDVLLHHPPSHQSSRTLLVAVDPSSHSAAALAWAVANIVRPADDKIVLATVRPSVDLRGAYVGSLVVPGFKDADEALRKESHDLLLKLAKTLPAEKYNVHGVALRGDPREELLFAATDLNADILVVGSRGLGPLRRTLLGSVSDYLVRHAEIPVIVARDD
ncbi:hypothetical protein DFJ73DRAFT_773497 [Zopfochytrium polystomum]|nr:hypothetical protein DFJ73DRAFT_773497 [Zopfochytrium polystomum]